MNDSRFTFDTNIFFYAADVSSGKKHLQAQSIMRMANVTHGRILLQTLGEFIYSVGRKRPAARGEAQRIALGLCDTFPVISTEPDDFRVALQAQKEHHLQFWDAMLWATAHRTGCNHLLTEDFQDGHVLRGVTFRNPFTMDTEELKELLS